MLSPPGLGEGQGPPQPSIGTDCRQTTELDHSSTAAGLLKEAASLLSEKVESRKRAAQAEATSAALP